MTYLNVTEIESAVTNLAAAYSTAERIALPHSTHDGRSSSALRIGTQSASQVDGVLLLGGVHAREWIPPDAMISLAADLLEAHSLSTGLTYGGKSFTADQIRQVVENLNLFIYPCVNPDGRHHSQNSESLWRKNRRPHSSGGGCVGVDLNRNFDFLWDHLNKFASDSGVSASDDPCNFSVYRGPSAESEPETRNVVWLLDNYSRIRWHIDVHSAVPVILHSWGSDENQSSDPNQNFLNSSFDSVRGRSGDTDYGEYISSKDLTIATTLSDVLNDAVLATNGNNYGYEQAYGLYPTSGASDDYAFSRHFADPSKKKVYGFTIECGTSFQPPYAQAEDVIREVSAGLIAFCLEAPCVTDPLEVTLATPTVVFNDVPEAETTARSVTFDVVGCDAVTLEVTSGPTGSFNLLLGSSITLPAEEVPDLRQARIWLTYTGTTAGATATGSVDVRCVETGETWTVPISANTIARPKVAVSLVLDQSGSMDFDAGDGRKRVDVLKEAAQTFVDVIQPTNALGIVRFDHDAFVGMNIQDAGPEVFGPGRAAATAAVAAHVANPAGATSIGDGIELAGSELDATTGFDSTAMIVLTDGQENSPKFIADVASQIDDNVFAIGLGAPEVINPAALDDITNSTGGYVVMTGNLSQDEYFLLSKYYLQILAGVTNEEVVLDPQGHVKPRIPVEIPFTLNETDAGADVILLSPAPSVIDFYLRTPNGDIIKPTSPPTGVTFASGKTTSYYRFNLPLVNSNGVASGSGKWTAILDVDSRKFGQYLESIDDDKEQEYVRTHGVRYAVEVHARSSLKFKGRVQQKSIEPGSTLRLSANLSEFGIPMGRRRARVTAEITGPFSQVPKIVKLKQVDDGLFQGTFKTTENGTYKVRLVANGKTLRGTPFTRETTLSGSVYRPRPPEEPPKPVDPQDRPPKGCQQQFQALWAVLKSDRQLARYLTEQLMKAGADPKAVYECVKKSASS